jgi:hypothetical protein
MTFYLAAAIIFQALFVDIFNFIDDISPAPPGTRVQSSPLTNRAAIERMRTPGRAGAAEALAEVKK